MWHSFNKFLVDSLKQRVENELKCLEKNYVGRDINVLNDPLTKTISRHLGNQEVIFNYTLLGHS